LAADQLIINSNAVDFEDLFVFLLDRCRVMTGMLFRFS